MRAARLPESRGASAPGRTAIDLVMGTSGVAIMTKDDDVPEVLRNKLGAYQQLVTAGHIGDSRLSQRGRRILRWLSESDYDTIGGLEELLRLVHEGGACRHRFSNLTWCAICTPVKDARDVSRK